MTVRCLLFYAAWFGLEVNTSDVRVAFMHAVASEPKFAQPPVEQRAARWLWLIKKATNGMRTASKGFGDLVADVMKEIQFERGKADLLIDKDTKSQAAIVFHVDDPILASSRQQTASERRTHLLKAHEVITPDRPNKYLSRQYVKVHAHGRRGFRVRLLPEYFDSIATALEVVGCGTRAVPGRKRAGPTVGRVGQEQRMLEATNHSRYRAGVGNLLFMINEVPEIAYAVKNLSRQLAKPSHLDMQDLKHCVRYTLRHRDEWLFLTAQDKPRKTDEVAMIEVYTDADWAGDAKSIKSTSSVFTRIDWFLIGMNAQLQDTHAQSSGESEFYALGAGCADGLHVNSERSRHASQDQSAMRRQGSKRTGAETRFVQLNTARESEVLVRTRPRQGERRRSVASTDRNESGRHWDETLAKSQIGIPQEFDGKERRERDDVLSRPDESDERTQMTVSTDDVDKVWKYGNSWNWQTSQSKQVTMRYERARVDESHHDE